MPLSWNEIKSRAMAFSRRWQDAADEKQQSIPFWIDFFDIFGLTNRRVASFERDDMIWRMKARPRKMPPHHQLALVSRFPA